MSTSSVAKGRAGVRMGLTARVLGPLIGAAVGAAAGAALSPARAESGADYTIADQPARFAAAKKSNNQRVLDITKFYDPTQLKGKRVLVTGANRGVGLALSKQLVQDGALVVAAVRSASKELEDLGVEQIITGVDVQTDASMNTLVQQLGGKSIDVLINNAGYFWEPVETLENLNFDEELKMIDICAVGPLRISAALVKAGNLKKGSKIAMITSQGGSISWRDVQNPEGHDFGHHMSKAAANMMSKLLAQELKGRGIAVLVLHPGFNKTDMTAKYKDIWEIEGAVDVECGAMRVLHEINIGSMSTTGKFINCEDGLQIPW